MQNELNDLTEDMFKEVLNPTPDKIIQPASPESIPVVNNQVGGIDRAPHCTQLQKQERIEEVAEMLLQHKSNKEIQIAIAEKYRISPETVKNYLTDANKLIIDNVPEVKAIISKNIDTYRRIIKDSESDDKRTTILAMAGLEKLLRLHGPETQNNTQINLNFDNVDTEELIELIKQLTPNSGK
jgi:DNA-binding CsgD family transcriptional regulator